MVSRTNSLLVSQHPSATIPHLPPPPTHTRTHAHTHTRTEAEMAVKSLNGRWFGGRMITAEVYDQEKFETNDLSH